MGTEYCSESAEAALATETPFTYRLMEAAVFVINFTGSVLPMVSVIGCGIGV